MQTYKWDHTKFRNLPGPGDCDPPEPDELTDEDDDAEMSEEEFEDHIRKANPSLGSRPARVRRSLVADDTDKEE